MMQKPFSTQEPAFSAPFDESQMVTVHMQLHAAGHELALAVPHLEWTKLVSDFVKMPADERQRVGSSIRSATAESPFPEDGHGLSAAEQEKCDAFVNDCILLAALAEAVGPRVLTETAVEKYSVAKGFSLKQRLN
jgi:hypothetical protein